MAERRRSAPGTRIHRRSAPLQFRAGRAIQDDGLTRCEALFEPLVTHDKLLQSGLTLSPIFRLATPLDSASSRGAPQDACGGTSHSNVELRCPHAHSRESGALTSTLARSSPTFDPVQPCEEP